MRLVEEVDHAVGEGIHGASDFDGTFVLEVFEDGTAAADFGDGESDIGASDGVDIGGVFAGLVAVELGGSDSGLDAGEQAGEIAEDDIVDGAFDGATGGVSEDEHEFSAGGSTGKFHATEHVVVNNVAGDAADEGVANTGIEDDFGGNAGIDAAEDNSSGILAGSAGALFGEVVAGSHFAGAEALVALFEFGDHHGRGHRITFRFGERVGKAGRKLSGVGTEGQEGERGENGAEESAAMQCTEVGRRDRFVSHGLSSLQ